MNEEEEWRPPTMEEFEAKFIGSKKKEEPKKAEEVEEVQEETREEKLLRLKSEAKTKRQELDSIYKEMEDTL